MIFMFEKRTTQPLSFWRFLKYSTKLHNFLYNMCIFVQLGCKIVNNVSLLMRKGGLRLAEMCSWQIYYLAESIFNMSDSKVSRLIARALSRLRYE